MMIKKYKMLKIFPIVSNGCSTGLAPIHVNTIKFLKKVQTKILLFGKNFLLLMKILVKDKITIITIDIAKAITPPNLFGIERRTA
jgi:hypothetical protein